MNGEYMKKIEERRAGMTCSHGLKCIEEGNDHLCKTLQDEITGKKVLICTDYTNQKACKFADPFGAGEKPHGYFCKCPINLNRSRLLQK